MTTVYTLYDRDGNRIFSSEFLSMTEMWRMSLADATGTEIKTEIDDTKDNTDDAARR